MAQRDAIFEPDKVRIGKQIVLPFTKALEISLKSLRIRFWRSMITISGIILAIAFLTFVWTSNEIQQRIQGLPETIEDYGKLEEIAAKRGLELGVTTEGLDPRYKWVIGLALMICVVGIVNAMLMSVTERIREIGTMKCLGALDTFIVKLFMLESSFTGVAGTLIGIAVGGVLAFLWALISYGKFTIIYFPGLAVTKVLLLALVIGAGLSIFAAIFPAYRAAKMQPVDAMRVEE